MNRREAERIYDSGREAVIEQLLLFAAHIRKLEQNIIHLSRNSSNSSRPPSSDLPGMKKAKKKTKSTRRQGGQPGHIEQGVGHQSLRNSRRKGKRFNRSGTRCGPWACLDHQECAASP